MPAKKPRLAPLLDRLEELYGRPNRPIPRAPLDWILWENVAYLVDDERRAIAYRALATKVGLTAEEIAKAPRKTLHAIASQGGMHPEQRVERLLGIAALAREHGGGDLSQVLELPPAQARKILKQFPGIGDPGAGRIRMLCGASDELALESNGLRVVVRLGYGQEKKSWSTTYHLALAALGPQLRKDPAWLSRAHHLLREHGKNLCKRTAPDCDACPLSADCRYYAREG